MIVIKKRIMLAATLLSAVAITATAQQQKPKHEDTEFYEPVPKTVTPGKSAGDAPSDAVILFDGKNLDQWVSTSNRSNKADWKVNGNVLTVDKSKGNIETKQAFGSYQLHIEWLEPQTIKGEGQARGNSGIFLAATGPGDGGYELQVLDSYKNPTYVNGMAGSIYKQAIPLANAARKPGEWQVYDVIWTAPTFNTDGSVKTTAKVTVMYNGILVQNNFELQGQTVYVGKPSYARHDKSPIKLQSHGDPSEPISFRNIWVREL